MPPFSPSAVFTEWGLPPVLFVLVVWAAGLYLYAVWRLRGKGVRRLEANLSRVRPGLDAAGLFIVDRKSTNGSTVTTPDGVSTRCQPGKVIYVEVGSIVSIGDHWLEVRQVG